MLDPLVEPRDDRISEPRDDRFNEPRDGRVNEPRDSRVNEPGDDRVNELRDGRVSEPRDDRVNRINPLYPDIGRYVCKGFRQKLKSFVVVTQIATQGSDDKPNWFGQAKSTSRFG